MKNNYREIQAINYSTLSSLDRSPKSLEYDEPVEGHSIDMGTCVDVLLFDGEDALNEVAVFSDVEKPTATLGKLIDYCYYNNIRQEWEIEQVVNTKKDNGKYEWWSSTTKLESREALWKTEQFFNYLNFLFESKDKIALTSSDKNLIFEAVDTIKNHEFTSHIFIDGSSQVPLIHEIEGYKYKGLLDWIVIDEKKKIIYPYDLKTTSKSLRDFPVSVLKYRYDIQSSLYSHLLQEEFPECEIADFKMVVYSFKDKSVNVFNLKNYYDKAKTGYTLDNKHIKGWLQLSEEYVWHTTNEKYDHSKDVYESNGEIVL